MRMKIVDRCGRMTESDRAVAERRLLFALSRFAPRLGQVELTVDDVNGPRGGIDIECRLRVVLHGDKTLIVVGRDAELLRCVADTASRMGRTVARRIDRGKQPAN